MASEGPVTDTSLSVCVVDDDDAVRDSLQLLLGSHDMKVHAFSAPRAFLAAAESLQPDCYIFDLHMPDMTGLELAEKVRASQPATPILIVTGRADPALAKRIERAGVSAVLSKPLSDDELVRAIREARQRAAGRASRH